MKVLVWDIEELTAGSEEERVCLCIGIFMMLMAEIRLGIAGSNSSLRRRAYVCL